MGSVPCPRPACRRWSPQGLSMMTSAHRDLPADVAGNHRLGRRARCSCCLPRSPWLECPAWGEGGVVPGRRQPTRPHRHLSRGPPSTLRAPPVPGVPPVSSLVPPAPGMPPTPLLPAVPDDQPTPLLPPVPGVPSDPVPPPSHRADRPRGTAAPRRSPFPDPLRPHFRQFPPIPSRPPASRRAPVL